MGEINFPLETTHFFIEPKDPGNLWREEWNILLKKEDRKQVGTLRFEEASFHDEVYFSADLDKEYDRAPFGVEIFYAMSRFAFRFKNIREISTVCRHDNDNRIRSLEKAGYVWRRSQDGDVYYSMKKQKTSWTGLYAIIGMISGFIMGITISNLWVGTIAGVLIGTVIGVLMDKNAKKESIE